MSTPIPTPRIATCGRWPGASLAALEILNHPSPISWEMMDSTGCMEDRRYETNRQTALRRCPLGCRIVSVLRWTERNPHSRPRLASPWTSSGAQPERSNAIKQMSAWGNVIFQRKQSINWLLIHLLFSAYQSPTIRSLHIFLETTLASLSIRIIWLLLGTQSPRLLPGWCQWPLPPCMPSHCVTLHLPKIECSRNASKRLLIASQTKESAPHYNRGWFIESNTIFQAALMLRLPAQARRKKHNWMFLFLDAGLAGCTLLNVTDMATPAFISES